MSRDIWSIVESRGSGMIFGKIEIGVSVGIGFMRVASFHVEKGDSHVVRGRLCCRHLVQASAIDTDGCVQIVRVSCCLLANKSWLS